MIRIGSRTSRLALAQTLQVAQRLGEADIETEIVPSDTLGDRCAKRPVHELGVAGAFTTALEAALLRNEIDLAVHSLKDLPTQTRESLSLPAILERGRAKDVLLLGPAACDEALPLGLAGGARVATSGPRRRSQLLAVREDLALVDVRGNVDTRVAKLREGRFDALVTAGVVLDRIELELGDLVVHPLSIERFPPAPGQAAIAVQARQGSRAQALVARLDHAPTRTAVKAERGLLARLGGGCGLAFGAHVRPSPTGGEGWRLDATFAGHGWNPTCKPLLRRQHRTGLRIEGLLHEAIKTLATIEPQPRRPRLEEAPSPPGEPVLVIASRPTARQWAAVLREGGYPAVPVVTKRFEPADPPTASQRARLRQVDWIAVTSRQAAKPLARALEDQPLDAYVAAVGPATARALQGQGLPCHVIAPEATGASLGEELARLARGEHVLLVQAEDAYGGARDRLAKAQLELDIWKAYVAREQDVDLETIDAELPASTAIVTSPANVQALPQAPEELAERYVAIGPSTAQALREIDLEPAVAERPRPEAVLEVLT